MSKTVPVAIQLYSLRTVIENDVPGTLRRVAEMGYQGVELAGTYDLSGKELRDMLEANGLRCAGAHVGMPLLEGDVFDETVATQQELGNDRLIIPSADLDNLDATITGMNAIYERAKAAGMQVGFHNHMNEFNMVDGKTKFDHIFSRTPADFLVQVDIGWASAAGQDVPALLRQYADRIKTVHVKEYKPETPQAVVGEGTVDWAPLMDIMESETAVEWYIVEQEQYEVGPLESAQACVEHIRKLRSVA